MMHGDAGDNNSASDKVLKKPICASVPMVALTVLMLLTAQAADPGFCRAYAEAAVNQVRGALANPACARGIQGTRWSPEHRVHLDWCLTQPIPTAEAERGARTAYLR
jgi:hypothetical protein